MLAFRRSSMLCASLLAGLSMAGISGCHHQEAAQPQPAPAAASASAAVDTTVAPISSAPVVNPAVAAQATVPTVQVQLPASSFLPNPNDVLSAFAQSLAGTVLKMQPSPKRDEWYRNQVMVLKSLKVGGCTQSTPGTKSTCRVSLGGQEFDAHLILTKQGWSLVQ
jgi:hypothetical protein